MQSEPLHTEHALSQSDPDAGGQGLTREQGLALLRFVRDVARDALTGSKLAAAPAFADTVEYGGVFTTLRNGHRLRGCMGSLAAHGPFAGMVAEVTRSALRDPRFRDDPVTAEELPELTIEVSILGSVRRVDDPSKLVAGRHGVIISRDGRSGCFLPQVATERGWSMEVFLSECCRQKAGLEGDAWRDGRTRIEAFEVRIFQEPGRT